MRKTLQKKLLKTKRGFFQSFEGPLFLMVAPVLGVFLGQVFLNEYHSDAFRRRFGGMENPAAKIGNSNIFLSLFQLHNT